MTLFYKCLLIMVATEIIIADPKDLEEALKKLKRLSEPDICKRCTRQIDNQILKLSNSTQVPVMFEVGNAKCELTGYALLKRNNGTESCKKEGNENSIYKYTVDISFSKLTLNCTRLANINTIENATYDIYSTAASMITETCRSVDHRAIVQCQFANDWSNAHHELYETALTIYRKGCLRGFLDIARKASDAASRLCSTVKNLTDRVNTMEDGNLTFPKNGASKKCQNLSRQIGSENAHVSFITSIKNLNLRVTMRSGMDPATIVNYAIASTPSGKFESHCTTPNQAVEKYCNCHLRANVKKSYIEGLIGRLILCYATGTAYLNITRALDCNLLIELIKPLPFG